MSGTLIHHNLFLSKETNTRLSSMRYPFKCPILLCETCGKAVLPNNIKVVIFGVVWCSTSIYFYLYDRSLKIIEENVPAESDILYVINANNIRACELFCRRTYWEACDIFRGYFEVKERKTKTRNNQCFLKLPRIRTKYVRKSFRFMVAKIYDELPIDNRKTESFNDYNQPLKKHFS